MLDDGKALLNGITKKAVQFSAEDSILMLSPQSMDSREVPFSDSGLSRAQANMSNDSSDEEDTDDGIHVQSPLKPKLSEPDWQIINASRSESGKEPFKKEIEMIEEITSPVRGRGRSGTVTQAQHSATVSTTRSSQVTTPSSDILNPMSPLGSHPIPTSSPARSPSVRSPPARSPPARSPSVRSPATQSHPKPQNIHPLISTATTTTNASASPPPPPSTTTSDQPPRRARSIKEIRADLEHRRQQSIARSAEREIQREAERVKVQAELEEAERTLESAAGLSIARQISISQSQRQLLRPIQSRTGSGSSAVHRKAVGSGSISSVNSGGGERDGATGLVVPVAGLGSNKENDAMLLSSGGFNNPIPASTSSSKTSSPEPHTARIESSSSTSSFIKINSAGGFDFNNYERPSISHHQRGQSFETGPEYITTTTTGSGRDRERERPVVGGGSRVMLGRVL